HRLRGPRSELAAPPPRRSSRGRDGPSICHEWCVAAGGWVLPPDRSSLLGGRARRGVPVVVVDHWARGAPPPSGSLGAGDRGIRRRADPPSGQERQGLPNGEVR